MAANFWNSSHHKNWLRNSDSIISGARQIVHRDAALLNEEEAGRVKVMYCRLISELAIKSGLRQRVAATAVVYFKRFYVKNCMKDHDPRLIAPVALYLASKVEEHTLAAKVIIAHMGSFYPSGTVDHQYPYAVSHVYDYEFKLIAALDFDLIIFHPYRPMLQYCSDSQLTDLLDKAWPILNDSYLTDVCLLYPPYLIAIACIYLAGILADRDMRPWVATLPVSNQDIGDLTQILAGMYSSASLFSTSLASFDETVLNKLHAHYKGLRSLQGGSSTAGASNAAAVNVVSAIPQSSGIPGSKRPPLASRKH